VSSDQSVLSYRYINLDSQTLTTTDGNCCFPVGLTRLIAVVVGESEKTWESKRNHK